MNSWKYIITHLNCQISLHYSPGVRPGLSGGFGRGFGTPSAASTSCWSIIEGARLWKEVGNHLPILLYAVGEAVWSNHSGNTEVGFPGLGRDLVYWNVGQSIFRVILLELSMIWYKWNIDKSIFNWFEEWYGIL